MTTEALAEWARHPGVGKAIGRPEGYDRLGISIGSTYPPTAPIVELLLDLERLATTDLSLLLIPRHSTHFTFLAIAGHHWDDLNELPPETNELTELVARCLSNFPWRLNALRIIPGRNYLLLAGVPEERSIRMRALVAEGLKSSSWKGYLEKRYEQRGYPFPPLIWHTTLCRSSQEYLPETVRNLYHRYRDKNFGGVDLETPRLCAINYDWSTALELFHGK